MEMVTEKTTTTTTTTTITTTTTATATTTKTTILAAYGGGVQNILNRFCEMFPLCDPFLFENQSKKTF